MNRYTDTSKKQMKTSTPLSSASQRSLNISSISTISRSASRDNFDVSIRRNKNACIIQEELDYAYNVYLLSLATTKIQEQSLAKLTANNQDNKLSLLTEIEGKHSYLTDLINCEGEIISLSKQTTLLKKQKQVFEPTIDLILEKIKHLEMLMNSVEVGLSIQGFLPSSNASELKGALSKINRTLDKILPGEIERYTETAEAIDNIEASLSKMSELQNRCDTACAALQAAALENSSLSVMIKLRSSKQEL